MRDLYSRANYTMNDAAQLRCFGTSKYSYTSVDAFLCVTRRIAFAGQLVPYFKFY